MEALGFGLLLPVIPQLLANPKSPHYVLAPGTPPGTGYFLIGCLMATYPMMQFFSTPILGQLSDRYGRKPVLAFSLAGTVVGYVMFAFGVIEHNLWLMFIGRALDGVTGGTIAVSQAVIADTTEPKDRTKAFALLMGVNGAALMLGPFLGGVLADPSNVSWFSAATPFWFAAILATLNTVGIMLLFTETNTQLRPVSVELARNLKNLARSYAHPELSPILLAGFFAGVGVGLFISFLGAFLTHRFGFDEADTGNFFAYVGIWALVTQLVTTRVVAKRFAEPQVIRVTLLGFAVMVGLYVLPTESWWLFLIGPLVSTFSGLSFVNLSGLLSRSARREVQGEIMGIFSSIQAFSMAFPLLIMAPLAAVFSPAAIIGAAALALFLGWLSFVAFYKPTLQTPKTS